MGRGGLYDRLWGLCNRLWHDNRQGELLPSITRIRLKWDKVGIYGKAYSVKMASLEK
jgi:hypothetical protein